MARRKRILEDDDDSDSFDDSEAEEFRPNESADAREERELFQNPYQRKRRKRNGKEDALYGIFAEEDEDESGGGGIQKSTKSKRSDWTKAPAFVSGEKKVDLGEENEMNIESESEEKEEAETSSDGEGEGEGAEEYSDNDSDPSRRPSPRIREEDDDEDAPTSRPQIGGIGHAKKSGTGIGFSSGGMAETAPPAAATTSSTFSKGGIGSWSSLAKAASTELPSSFGSQSQSTSFVRNSQPARPAVPLSHVEQAHFAKLSGTFGARMLEKMGWQAGQGLGTTGEGIVTPIESKMRPEKSGIAFRGFKEKTEQSKMEARRRGEVVSDDEDPRIRKAHRKEREAKEKKADAWRKPKKVKTKVQHKTYEEILAEAGPEVSGSSGIGQIIDATGAVPREVTSLADVAMNSWTPSADSTRIPEVRHNVRLIAESCKTDLDGLAREGKLLEERKKLVNQEDLRLRKRIEDEAELIARLQQVQLVTMEINAKVKALASDYDASLDEFSSLFYKLTTDFESEFDRYRLDEVVVAAIAPLVRRMVAQWQPMEDPKAFISTFRNWRRALRVSVDETLLETQVDIYGTKTATPVQISKPMTPFESLLWNVWLPKVRTVINNEWSPKAPQPALKLYEAWSTFLPPFIRDNILDQLILPKVQKAVADWNAKLDQVPLQTIVFPWLPHVGLRLEDFIGDARRKLKSLLRNWAVGDDLPAGLKAWKDVFDVNDWDSMLLKYIVPKLGATLRDDFRVNPRNQIMEPIQHVLQWSDILRPSIFSQLFETEFFPKWLDVLHVWLIQPKVSFEEVAQWYSFWKNSFPEKLQGARGFTRGLQLMNQAIELGPDAPSRLPKPDYKTEQALSSAPNSPRNGVAKSIPARPSARTQEITFRSIVEEFAASHNLLFMPTGRTHEKSRMPLFRVSSSMDRKGGLLVYILDDAVWAAVEGVGGATEDYKAISLDSMVLRAN